MRGASARPVPRQPRGVQRVGGRLRSRERVLRALLRSSRIVARPRGYGERMRAFLAVAIVLFACAGPGKQRLAETPTARTRVTPTEAPPASTSDRDRDELVKSMDSMKDAQDAHAESHKKGAPPPALPPDAQPTSTPASPDRR